MHIRAHIAEASNASSVWTSACVFSGSQAAYICERLERKFVYSVSRTDDSEVTRTFRCIPGASVEIIKKRLRIKKQSFVGNSVGKNILRRHFIQGSTMRSQLHFKIVILVCESNMYPYPSSLLNSSIKLFARICARETDTWSMSYYENDILVLRL